MHSRVGSWSLRRRLGAIAVFACTATLLAGGTAMYRADHIGGQKVQDSQLVALAQTVLGFADHEIEEVFAEGRVDAIQIETETTLGTRFHYQIWSSDGRLLLRSHLAPAGAPIRPLAERDLGNATVGGESVRTYSQEAKSGAMLIQVAERLSDRQAAIGVVTGYFLAFLVVPLVLIFFCTWWFLDRSLHSIDSYASQLRQRHVLDLAPLQAANPPTELEPMVASINALFGRFGHALAAEREFTAVAAHEMRTPLAGLRAQAQLASKLAHSPQELVAALRGLMQGIDQASHLQDQLLDLARIDSLAVDGGDARSPVSLQEAYHRVMADLGPAAAERNLALKDRFEVAQLDAVEIGLHLLMHNLLVNAIRYTPPGGSIEIGSTQDDRAVTLTVDDSGPGIPASQHAAAFQRFNRLGQADSRGVGLGLSIVQSVAQAHQAVVRLGKSPLGGLRVQVLFPASPTA